MQYLLIGKILFILSQQNPEMFLNVQRCGFIAAAISACNSTAIIEFGTRELQIYKSKGCIDIVFCAAYRVMLT
jgi:hypothetical protein